MRLVEIRGTAASCAALLIILVSVGCGGGGGGDDDNSPQVGGDQGTAAPVSIAGDALVLSGTENRRIEFASAGDTWTEDQNGYVTGGTYQYRPSGSMAELILVDSVGETPVQLAFTEATSGTYKIISNGSEGSFTLESIGEPGPNPEPGDPIDPSSLAPASLDGRTMYGTRTFTSTGPVGQTHVYTFSGGMFHDSDPPEESDGGYVYEPSGNRAWLTLNYYAPRAFNGDRHELEMRFHSQTRGTFESTYTRRDGTVISINGTFRID